jgi:phenylalanyl-tRNA synthetase alpha chain
MRFRTGTGSRLVYGASTLSWKVRTDAMSITDQLVQMRNEGLAAVAAAADVNALDSVRVEYLGKKGSLTAILRGLGQLSAEERPAAGKVSNEVRVALEAAIDERKATLAAAELDARIGAEAVDVTLPGRARPVGSRHLIEQITAEIVEIFIGLGYKIAEGPEVELDYYNFTALNQPPDHPARSLQDTFYVRDLSGEHAAVEGESDVLLRTHTSPVQMRVMESAKPPIYILAPGKVYRRDIADPSHLPQFTQIEGLVVDEGITFGDLKGTLDYACRAIFGPDRKTRFRPHFFPFTEPSAEVDVSCGICGGEGCRFCKGTGWLEILGCGMVDPNVFGYAEIDPERYSGFAFGMGVERIAALRYNIPDLRMLLEGDMRFLRQF